MADDIFELVSNERNVDVILSEQAHDAMIAEVENEFPFILESSRQIYQAKVMVVKDNIWDKSLLSRGQGWVISNDDGESIIAISEFRAKKLFLDIEDMIRDSNYTEEEYKKLEDKRKVGQLEQSESDRLRSLGRIWTAVKDQGSVLETLKHEWLHVQAPIPASLYPHGIAFFEMYPMFFTSGIGYQDVKTIMDLLRISIGEDQFILLLMESIKTDDSIEYLIAQLRKYIGDDLTESIQSYLPIGYSESDFSQSNYNWVTFEELCLKFMKHITSIGKPANLSSVYRITRRKDLPGGNVLPESLINWLEDLKR